MKILLEAPILTQSGYGEHSRLVFKSLMLLDGVHIYTNPLNWGATSWACSLTDSLKSQIDQSIFNLARYAQESGDNPEFDVQIHVGIPSEFEKKAPYSVCVTAGIETDRVSPEWLIRTHKGIDKIIVPSEHAKSGFIKTSYEMLNNQTQQKTILQCNSPVDVVPYPVKNIEPKSLDFKTETDFNFLSVGLLGPRKNIENMIQWFVEEFKDENVGLILKTARSRGGSIDSEQTVNHLKRVLLNYKDRKCKVYLLHGDLEESEVHSLYLRDDVHAFVTTTHGEGYGLPMFEAAYSGLPIVATDWSAHTEFLRGPLKESGKTREKKLFARVDYELKEIPKNAVWKDILSEGSFWAFPKKNSFKHQIRKVYKNHGMYKKWAKVLSSKIKETHSEQAILEKMGDCLLGQERIQMLAPLDTELLPKISLITSVFRAEDYIDQLMEDITRQSVFSKCEWIILNANKPGFDYEEEVILKYKEKYPENIIYERMAEDPGIYDTWNKGIKMSTGEYITNVNCDDRRSIDGLEKQAAMLYNNPDVELVYNDSYITHEPNIMFEDVTSDTQKYNFEQFSVEAMLRGNLPHNNPMWKSSIHEKHGYFNQYYKSAGDWDFWLRCAFGGSKFMKHPEVLGVYYFNPTGMSTNPEHDSWKKVHEREIFTNYMNLYQERQKQNKAS